jgi:DNA topoisomerase-1
MRLNTKIPVLPAEPVESARAAGLRYVSDEIPGFSRVRRGQGFRYLDQNGKALRDAAHLRRIKSLAIPPAWTDVWICPLENGHLQSTGRDARRRKQHRYHSKWREVRDETKYTRMIAFAQVLPKIRKRVAEDLKEAGLSRNKVLAAIVRLLEVSLIRVGNDEYARDNKSYGLTTIRNRHATVRGKKITFDFRGKSGKDHRIEIEDPRLATIVKRCQDLPGQELFQYLDDDGKPQDVKSEDVNAYLHEIVGGDFTAKDFRTWAGTVLAALALQEMEKFDTKAQAKKNVVQAIETVAARLGNTPSVCRKCYVHPAVLNSYLEGEMLRTARQRAEREIVKDLGKLPPEEAAVLTLVQQRTALEANGGAGLLQKQLKASLRAHRNGHGSKPKRKQRLNGQAPQLTRTE